jgi:hypothetical protein
VLGRYAKHAMLPVNRRVPIANSIERDYSRSKRRGIPLKVDVIERLAHLSRMRVRELLCA